MTLYLALFFAGILTILLPCILPLLPIVLGVSIAGRNPWRPFLTVLGMVISFVVFTLLLQLVLSSFVEVAEYVRITTFYILLLFGTAFVFHTRAVQWVLAILGASFFADKGWTAMIIAAISGIAALEAGGYIGSRIQQTGTNIQQRARSEFGAESPITALFIGLTLGMVWVPCAGPALGFVFALLRDSTSVHAAGALFAYAAGTAIPLLLIGYGGQRAIHSVRAIAPHAGRIKQLAGVLLIFSAIGLYLHWFEKAQIWLLDHTSIGDVGTRLEERFFGDRFDTAQQALRSSSSMASTALKPMPSSASAPALRQGSGQAPRRSDGGSLSSIMNEDLPTLPKISRAPELAGLGAWFNSEPLTMAGLKGKVVLVDFWTYSCINCIRTLPYIKQYWATYKDTGKFVLLGIHAPEFVFEKSAANVQDAIDRHGLTYPIAQDNDFTTWRAFANRYWPAKYLIDADGYIRYTHFGEGDYDETDRAIRSLLKEAGADLAPTTIEEDRPGRRAAMTSETYLGERSWPTLGNAQGDPTSDTVTYVAPTAMDLHRYYLVGDWQMMDDERQVMLSNAGEIRMRFLGGEINLVLGLAEGAKPATGTVFIDGVQTRTIIVDRDDLFELFNGEYGEHEMVLKLSGKGVEGYAFTFGAGE